MMFDPEEIEEQERLSIEASLARRVPGVEPIRPEDPDDYNMVVYAEEFARFAHGDQLYGDNPYGDHLAEVVSILRAFGYSEHFFALSLITGWLHDVDEDTAYHQDAISVRFGDRAGELVWACTGVGATRAEKQASIKVKLLADPEAQPPKGADRLANMRSSLREKKRKFVSLYSGEFDDFMTSVPEIPEAMKAALYEVQAQSLAFLSSNPA